SPGLKGKQKMKRDSPILLAQRNRDGKRRQLPCQPLPGRCGIWVSPDARASDIQQTLSPLLSFLLTSFT
ncbi:mCG50094, isoform CRA_a, partial [Mus musculus]